MSTRAFGGVLVALLVLHGALAWVARDPGIRTAHDDAHYLLLARSLQGLEYRDEFRVGAPSHAMYPPGYPAVLAVWSGVAGERFDRLVLINLSASIAALALTALAVRRLWSAELGLLVTAPLAVNPHLISLAGRLFSESWYLLFTILALWALVALKPRAATRWVAGAAAVAAGLTRTIGVALVGGLALHWLLERRWRATIALTATVVVVLGGWLWWTYAAAEPYAGASYLADAQVAGAAGDRQGAVTLLASRAIHNAPVYLGLLIPYHLPLPTIRGTPVDNAIAALFVAACLAVGVVVVFRRWRPACLYGLSYGVVLLAWPWQVSRFLVPLLPLLVLGVLVGAAWSMRAMRPAWERPAVVAVAAVLTVTAGFQTAGRLAQDRHCERGAPVPSPACMSPDQASFFAAMRYVTERVPPDAVFLSAKPATLYYYTGRRTVSLDATVHQTPASVLPFLREEGVEYILLASLHWHEPGAIARLLEPNCTALEPLAEFPPRTFVLRVRPPGGQPNSAGCSALAAYRRASVGRDLHRDP